MRLYHGSKCGIEGPIRPISRSCCDFGRGFYMGNEQLQPKTLICRSDTPKLYTLEFDSTGLVVRDLTVDLPWALFVAYNRGRMPTYAGTVVEDKMRELIAGADVLHGRIANDRVFFAAERFFDGSITIETLVAVLKALNYGDQYVAVTQRACNAVRISSERTLDETECANLLERSERQRKRAEELTASIMRERRHMDGRYIDEICDEIVEKGTLPCS